MSCCARLAAHSHGGLIRACEAAGLAKRSQGAMPRRHHVLHPKRSAGARSHARVNSLTVPPVGSYSAISIGNFTFYHLRKEWGSALPF